MVDILSINRQMNAMIQGVEVSRDMSNVISYDN